MMKKKDKKEMKKNKKKEKKEVLEEEEEEEDLRCCLRWLRSLTCHRPSEMKTISLIIQKFRC